MTWRPPGPQPAVHVDCAVPGWKSGSCVWSCLLSPEVGSLDPSIEPYPAWVCILDLRGYFPPASMLTSACGASFPCQVSFHHLHRSSQVVIRPLSCSHLYDTAECSGLTVCANVPRITLRLREEWWVGCQDRGCVQAEGTHSCAPYGGCSSSPTAASSSCRGKGSTPLCFEGTQHLEGGAFEIATLLTFKPNLCPFVIKFKSS